MILVILVQCDTLPVERKCKKREFYNDKLCIWEKDECHAEKIRHIKKLLELDQDQSNINERVLLLLT